jgi:hypothetical protein
MVSTEEGRCGDVNDWRVLDCSHEVDFLRKVIKESFDSTVLDGAGSRCSAAGVAQDVLSQFCRGMVEEHWSSVNTGEQVLETWVSTHFALGHAIGSLDNSFAVRAYICGVRGLHYPGGTLLDSYMCCHSFYLAGTPELHMRSKFRTAELHREQL